jgi:exodeoxyribonuclease V alpha subunit
MNVATPLQQRAIDLGLAHWVQVRTGSALLARAAFAASAAEGEGHACARFGDDFALADIETLRSHAWVGGGAAFTPFVLDPARRFYLWRNWKHEERLADGILARCADRALPLAVDAIAADLDALFGSADVAKTRGQRAAVAAVPGARFFVLTGGPGTGKTSTVVRMLLMLLRHATACGLPEQPAIALAAPTGKAAQRLAQAIARGKDELMGNLAADSPFRALLPAISQADARTLHRLLGFRPDTNGYAYGAEKSLPADIVIVDEASMADLAMMRQLIDALRAPAVLILLGDPDQLASVDAGSVLADIVAGVPRNGFPAALAARLAPALGDSLQIGSCDAPLAGHVVTLEHVWRAGGELQRAIQALRDDDREWLDHCIDAGGNQDLRVHACVDAAALQVRVESWLDTHADIHARLFAPDIGANEALTCLRKGQLLCALRDGVFGAQGVNALMTRHLAERHRFDPIHAWYHGRPVIVTRNDYARGLFNGDVGIALAGTDGLRVWFETSDRSGASGLRSFSPRVLPACETAWAITIHRSQGSEYDDVAVVLPPDAEHRLLSRELVYTAVSRARRRVELWTTEGALRNALARRVERQGGLRNRLGALLV